MRKRAVKVALGIVFVAAIAVCVWTTWDVPDAPRQRLRRPSVERLKVDRIPGTDVGIPARGMLTSGRVSSPPAAPKTAHPLLGGADDAVLADQSDEVTSTAGPELTEVIRAVVESRQGEAELAVLTIDYPLNETIFPQEIVAPTFLWHEPVEEVDTWLIDAGSGDETDHIYVLVPGDPPPAGQIDLKCIAESNDIYQPTPYQASARSWTPAKEVWGAIKQRSSEKWANVAIVGFSSTRPHEALSHGRITISTSKDPVGAPIFYRDVPLAPSQTKEGEIKPLGSEAVPLIAWRLRDISKRQSRLLLTDLPTCTNCHSVSADGSTLGMDLDGPQGDKGAYVIAPVAKQMAIEKKDVITWNSFQDKPKDHRTIGFMSQISPHGQYAVTTLNEAVYVSNFMDYRFLQAFYPTRGILGYYSRATGEIKALPGADDPKYVHCDAVWSPDGEYLVFARAEAKDPYSAGAKLATHPNDPAETQIQYDLYRIPFNGGQGGKPVPIAGASNNGMSNTFPKVSPDGKWIVFVKCRNGQLMRPDSKLWIVSAEGGPARLMRCNTWRMNSWHSFSPNGRWLVFSSKANTPYTQMHLTHIDGSGNDSPAILIPDSTAANRAVNIPEFVNIPYDELERISVPVLEYLKHDRRGVHLAREGKLNEAIAHFDMAVEANPDYLKGHVNAALALLDMGKPDAAMARLTKVLDLAPDRSDAHGNLGTILARKGLFDEAIVHFEAALKQNPDYFEAHVNLGTALQQKGLLERATLHFRAAAELSPKNPRCYFSLGRVFLDRGMPEEAVKHFETALQIEPRFVDARLSLGKALASQHDFASAVVQFQEATAIEPANLRAINDLAWLLAVCPQDDIRNGPKAIDLAARACAVTGFRDPILMTTLAAAYAETGKFSDAVVTATKALDLVMPQGGLPAQRISQQLKCYELGKPYRYWP